MMKTKYIGVLLSLMLILFSGCQAEGKSNTGISTDEVSEDETPAISRSELAWVRTKNISGDAVYYTYGYINEKGEEVIPCQYDDARDFSDNGLAAVKKSNLWGYIDATGKVIIDFQFASAKEFSKNGLAAVSISEGEDEDGDPIEIYGYINEKGETVIDYLYTRAGSFTANGLAWVSKKMRQEDGRLANCYGYINADGDIKIDFIYSEAQNFFDNGLALVAKYNEDDYEYLYGYINEKGEEVIQCQYKNVGYDSYKNIAGEFSQNGLLPVQKNNSMGYWGYVNEKGEEIIPCQYEHAGHFSNNGLAPVDDHGIWCYINIAGEKILELQYNCLLDFSENAIAFVGESYFKTDTLIAYRYGVINEQGAEISESKYDSLIDEKFVGGLARVGIEKDVDDDGKTEMLIGLLNEKGEEVLPCQYDHIGKFADNGLALIEYNGLYGYINTQGEVVIKYKYLDAGDFRNIYL